jgi:hypothetical protein
MLHCRRIGVFDGHCRALADLPRGSLLDRSFQFAAAARLRPAVVGVIVVVLGTGALAQSPVETGYRALWPLPVAPLQPAEDPSDAMATGEIAAVAAIDPEADADAALFAPLRLRPSVPATRAERIEASRAVPFGVIRKGLPAHGTAALSPSERAVGLKLGSDDIFAVSTRVVAPADGTSSDARIDWRLARPVSPDERGFVWMVATGGSTGIASHPDQNADLMVGYRQPVFAYLMLTSQLTMQGNYVFAPGDGAHSAIVPEVRLSTNLNALADLPFDASFDLGVAHKLPLLASQPETARGSAMLRVKYSLD